MNQFNGGEDNLDEEKVNDVLGEDEEGTGGDLGSGLDGDLEETNWDGESESEIE